MVTRPLNENWLKAAEAFARGLPETVADPLPDLESDDLGWQDDDKDIQRAADAEAAEPTIYRETCGRCHGSGTYMMGTCFKCGGRGVQDFRTSPEQRAKRAKPTPESRAKYQDKKERDEQRNRERFAAANPDVHAWLKAASDRGFRVAQGMLGDIGRFGSLKPNSIAAAQRLMQQDRERDERRAAEKFQAEERSEPVNTVNLQAVEEAFERAKQAGIRTPKLTLDGFTLVPAKASSGNAGAIYVKNGREYEAAYLGKVLGGSFLPSRECDEDTKAKVLAAMADPLASAVAYGKKFGKCAVCYRDLTDEKSIADGIGPVCKERLFGSAPTTRPVTSRRRQMSASKSWRRSGT